MDFCIINTLRILFYMDNNQQIRKRRENIRCNLRNTLIKNGQLLSSHLRSPLHPKNQHYKWQQKGDQEQGEGHGLTIGRMRRKTSLDIRILGQSFDMFECTQVFIYNQFHEMYELMDKIDEGAQSVVYQALEKKTGKKFAVKVFKKKDQDFINRIKTQFRILKNLEHPHIIKAYNLFINQKIGISHLILEYCEYPNLRFHLQKNRVLKETQVAEILSSVLSTLVYLHSQGVCHRDIKPENILFNPLTRQLKIIDFEISKMIKYSHQKLQMLTNTGTLYYKAPEMFGYGFYSQLVDIWAVGVICYEMITGDFPFKNLYESQVARQIRDCQPKYDEAIITDLCVNFMKKCMQKDPLKRFSAIQALKSPFILKYSSISSSNSSPMRRKNSEQNIRNVFEIEVSKCFNEDSGLKNTQSLQADNGIRLVINEKPIRASQ